ncbi:MAG: hypothetical protein K9M15_01935 [Candidatus Marinimicrobia bacterium]|nr:hypothetical protein [Candidatus Neomarinimicrobiota bacterium]
MLKPKIYFAHAVNTYGTIWEKSAIDRLQRKFPYFDIENPNQPHHQEEYKKWKEECGNGMNYFFEEVLPICTAGCVAMPFLDGLLGAGVAGETIWHFNAGNKIWLMEAPRFKNIRSFLPVEIKDLLRWEIIKRNVTEKRFLEMIETDLVLSIETTRKRTWKVLYKEFLPYEEAHMVN